jgi:ribosomal protein S18 acetylase RimI-like enzyme
MLGAGNSPILSTDPFANPVWNALQTSHQPLALTSGRACKYPQDVAPFAAVAENTPEALRDLHSLLLPGETTYLANEQPPDVAGLRSEGSVPCLQMVFPHTLALPEAKPIEIAPLTCADAAAMVELTSVAFPGFFRSRTCLMGSYYGVWEHGKLIAMGGERLVINPWREISGVCTHPEHRGKGYAPRLMTQLLQDHREAGRTSCLHVVSTNRTAIELYLRMGFSVLREIDLYRISRIDSD